MNWESHGRFESLPPDALHRRCDPGALPFSTTAELDDLDEVLGQDRAVEAIHYALGMRHPHYNLFVLGPEGAGRRRIVERILEERARRAPVADDWCYVHNFDDPTRPRALRLPAGAAVRLRADMDRLVTDLHGAIRAAFETEEYRVQREALEDRLKEKQERAIESVREDARRKDVALVNTPGGVALAPLRDGEVMGAEEVHQLPEEERSELESRIRELRDALQRTLHEAPKWEREHREQVQALDREVAAAAVKELMDERRTRWRDHAGVLAYLDAVERDVVENRERLMDGARRGPRALFEPEPDDHGWARRYRVNVLVDHSRARGAPRVYEDNPTLPAMIGRIEHTARLGALMTDFTLIRPGALHRANGGYLVVDALKLLAQPFAWDQLKRALKAGEICVETLGQMLSPITTVSLEPEPIPLELKVVLVGSRRLYYLLAALDPEFDLLFKVPADLEEDMDRDVNGGLRFARVVATLARREGLRPFDRAAVAQAMSRASRLAGDARKLTAHIESLADLLRAADHHAAGAGRDRVTADDVRAVVEADQRRRGRIRDRMLEEMIRGHIRIRTEGEAVGQLNGLMALPLGRFTFGQPVRITARVWMGRGRVIDIEREVHLGGPVHSKGVLILSGFLGARYAHDRPLALSASVVFEQSYGAVEGDSASLAETVALLSALGEVPLRQDIAMTGSIDQHGRAQAVGAVNEKIEGFFDLCAARGLTGRQGVVLPRDNVDHLMLREDVVRACAEGRFHVWPVEHIDEALELLTGLPAGERGADGRYPEGTVNARVEARLAVLAERAREFAGHDDHRPGEGARG